MQLANLYNDYGSVGDGFLGFVKGFFGYPAILIGIFSLIGCIVQRKRGSEILGSTLKTIVGFLIISGGASIISGTLTNLTNVIKNGFHMGSKAGMDFLIPSNEASMAFMNKTLPNLVTTASIIMIIAMCCNILLARFSNLKYIYLTGHVIFYTSLCLALGMYMAGLDPMNNVQDTVIALISGGMFMGLYMITSPAASGRIARKIVGNDALALGHTGGFGCAITGIIGVGILKMSKKDRLKSTEDLTVSDKWKFLTDNVIALSLTMMAIYVTIMMIALGISGLAAFDVTQGDPSSSMLGSDSISRSVGNAIVFSFVQALTFVGGILVCIYGVKMFLAELIPAFSGIATKVIKGSRAAVEVQAFWPYAQNGVIIGFLVSFGGGLLTFGILCAIHFGTGANTTKYFPVVLPELLPHLFIGGTGAVFGNKFGGVLGAIIGPFLVGFVWAWFPVIYKDLGMVPSELKEITVDGQTVNGTGSVTFSEVDQIITVLPYLLIKVNKWAWFGIACALFALPFILSPIVNAIKGQNGRSNKNDKNLKIEDIKAEQLASTNEAEKVKAEK